MTNPKPKIFISSTIYDFRDLRSALKYWLEQLGYEVRLSEFNDFTKPLDENSYNACLQAISDSDYYILFIGSRIGGFYNSTDKISITRKEYRTAYELMKSKKLKLVIFVREELWEVRRDRKALEVFLERESATHKEITPSDIRAIVNHPSDFVNDAETTFGFMDEIAREKEMKEAVAGKGLFPIGNWVHTYSTFQDVVEVLSTELGIMDSLSRIALRENLKHELLSNLQLLVGKWLRGEIKPLYHWAFHARKSLTGGHNDSSQMPGRYLRWLVMYVIICRRWHGLSTRFIDHALISGEFLEYDSDLNTYRNGPINNALFELRENIDRLRLMCQLSEDILTGFIVKYKPLMKTEDDVSVINEDLLVPLALVDCQQNIVELSVALIRALDGSTEKLIGLTLRPTSPFHTESARMKSETATADEIIRWVNEQ